MFRFVQRIRSFWLLCSSGSLEPVFQGSRGRKGARGAGAGLRRYFWNATVMSSATASETSGMPAFTPKSLRLIVVLA